MNDPKEVPRSAAWGFTKEDLAAALPPVLQMDPSVVALAEALGEVLAARPAEIDRLRIYPAIDTLDEPLLDILARDFKVDWWDAEYSLEEKRRTLKDSWRVHKTLGTKAAVETAISAIYPGTTVQEWFEYGGEPYHFKLTINLNKDTWDPEKQKRVLDKLDFYKNLRSHSDGIFYFDALDTILFPEKQALVFQSFRADLRISNTRRAVLRLNGSARLDGSWYLDQAGVGLAMIRAEMALRIPEQETVSGTVSLVCPSAQSSNRAALMQVSAALVASNTERTLLRAIAAEVRCQQSYGLSGTLIRDSLWRLDRTQRLDGAKRLDASIIKEEI